MAGNNILIQGTQPGATQIPLANPGIQNTWLQYISALNNPASAVNNPAANQIGGRIEALCAQHILQVPQQMEQVPQITQLGRYTQIAQVPQMVGQVAQIVGQVVQSALFTYAPLTQVEQTAQVPPIGGQLRQMGAQIGVAVAAIGQTFAATNTINRDVLNRIRRSIQEQNAPPINLQIINRNMVTKRVINTPPDLNRVISPYN